MKRFHGVMAMLGMTMMMGAAPVLAANTPQNGMNDNQGDNPGMMGQGSSHSRAAMGQRSDSDETGVLNALAAMGYANFRDVQKTGKVYQAEVKPRGQDWQTVQIDPQSDQVMPAR